MKGNSMKTSTGWDPEHYKKYARQAERGLAIAQSISLKGDEKILDVGCGDGRISAALAARLPRGSVVGLDISEPMIIDAQKTYANVTNLSFVCEDIARYASLEAFDIVVSFAAFHWVEHQQQALKNIYNSLKNGGRFFMMMSARDTKSPVSQIFASERWRSVLKHQKETYFGRTADEMVELLEQAGFQNSTVNYEHVETVYASAQESFDQKLTWLPYATGLSGDEVRQLAQEIVDKDALANGGRWVHRSDRLYVQTMK